VEWQHDVCCDQVAARREDPTKQGRRDPERGIGDDPERPSRQTQIRGVGLHDLDRLAREASTEVADPLPVELDRNHARARPDQRRRDRPRPGADIQHEITTVDAGRSNEASRPTVSESVEPPSIRTCAGHGAPSPLSRRPGWLIRTSPSHRIRVRRTIGRIVRTGIAVVVVLTAAGCSDDRRPQIGAPSTSSSALTASVATTATTEPTETTATAKVVADPASLTDRLQSVVDGFTVAQPVPFSVVVVDLSTGAQAAQLADRSVLSASLYKLFVARELIRRVEAGEVHGDAPAGDTMNRTIDQCIEAMIVVSDNACGVAGLRLVGGGGLDGRLHRDGFVSTSLASPQCTSAATS
jgi:hypothetical protein